MSAAVDARIKAKSVAEIAAVALPRSAVNESMARTCQKFDDLHLELQKRELKRFDEKAH